MSSHLVPVHPEPCDQALPWRDPIGPEAQLFGRLATLIGMMATEAALHGGEYRHAPDAQTLRQVSDALVAVAATPAPLGFLRQAMRQWRVTWATAGRAEEQARLGWGE
jgi:hypothetical protein